ncbi:MAG: thioesterase family protein [Ilumatobacter sp.]|jgi:acyl-CoA thioesterase FadM|uniref:thioesterase family protein n=1 Tax=Ilumatobacter sp. TaxID=1967498 RepID=UPI00391C683B
MSLADGLVVTHTSTVTPDQIDHLGHMNVRYYAVNARAATRALVGSGQIVEMYTRHLREQLLGAELEVHSGVIGVDAHSTRLYHELVNAATGDIAATFVYRARTETPIDTIDTIELPERGRPRSIDLDARMARPTLDEVRGLGLAMRAPRTIDRDDTAGGQTVPSAIAPMLFWGGVPVDGEEQQLVHTGPNGEDIGWATMETRLVIERPVELGTRIQSFSATTSIADKTTQMSMWVYDLDRGDLLASFELVSVLFDIGARRALSIPDDMRADYTARLHPELRSRAEHL